MKLTVKVTQKQNQSIAAILKQMCSLNCQISIDMAKGEIVVDKADEDDSISTVIDAIAEAFDITQVEIMPMTAADEAKKSMSNTSKKADQEAETSEQAELTSEPDSSSKCKSEANDTDSVVETKAQIPDVDEDSIEFERIKFSDQKVEQQINKLLRSIYWVMHHKEADTRDICKFIMSINAEILMKYAPKKVYYEIGDIVDCNYGNHPQGEVSGGHVHALILYVDDGNIPYAIPITKMIKSADKRYLPFTVSDGVNYYDFRYKGGTLLLDRGSFINEQCMGEVVGHVSEEFLDKILRALPKAIIFDDTEGFSEPTSETSDEIESSEVRSEVSVEQIPISDSTEVLEDAEHEGVKGNKTEKITKFEYLMQNPFLINGVRSIENLASESSSIEFKAEVFLEAIGFPKDDERIAINAFVAACNVKKIAWSEILGELRKIYDSKRINIKDCLQTMFNEWAKNNTAIKNDYPNMAFTELMRFFVKVIS